MCCCKAVRDLHGSTSEWPQVLNQYLKQHGSAGGPFLLGPDYSIAEVSFELCALQVCPPGTESLHCGRWLQRPS